MMHSNNFIVAILHNGKFIEESKAGVVPLPFGAEYTIRLRNKNDRRAVAKVYLDEENVTEGGIVVEAKNFVDLECDPVNHRKFKLVSVDSGEAIDVGKNNKTDDSNGVLRVEWQLEREYTQPPVPYWPPKYYPWWCGNPVSFSMGGQSYNNESPSINQVQSRRLHDACTVEGSVSDQRFYNTHVPLDGPITTIRIIIRGYKQEGKVLKYCGSCGHSGNTKKAKFCQECGKPLTKSRTRV